MSSELADLGIAAKELSARFDDVEKALDWQIGSKLSRMFVAGEGRGFRKVPKPESNASKLRRTQNAIASQRAADAAKTAAAARPRATYMQASRAVREQANQRRMAAGSMGSATPWRVVKGLPSALRAASTASPRLWEGSTTASSGYRNTRVAAHQTGRKIAGSKSTGTLLPDGEGALMSRARGQRTLSRLAAARSTRINGLMSPRQAEELGLNSYTSRLKRV